MTNKMSEHTKGPWQVTMTNAPFGAHPTNRVVSFRIGHENFTDKPYFTEEDEANACLMEHSPDMLKALESIIYLYDIGADYEENYNEIRQLIAKAKGQDK